MSLNKDPELKKAVLSLSQAEKDKVLVRLVGKDQMLMKQLRFKLLEDELDLEERILAVQGQLEQFFDRLRGDIGATNEHRNAHLLLAAPRYGRGIRNAHGNGT